MFGRCHAGAHQPVVSKRPCLPAHPAQDENGSLLPLRRPRCWKISRRRISHNPLLASWTTRNQPDHVEVVDHDRRRRRRPADRGPAAGRHFDGHEPDALTRGLGLLLQPGDGVLVGAALDLSQQTLRAGDVDEPGVPAAHRLLALPCYRVELVLRPAVAGLVDPRHLHRRDPGWQQDRRLVRRPAMPRLNSTVKIRIGKAHHSHLPPRPPAHRTNALTPRRHFDTDHEPTGSARKPFAGEPGNTSRTRGRAEDRRARGRRRPRAPRGSGEVSSCDYAAGRGNRCQTHSIQSCTRGG